ncbi:MAG: hypothetical protein KDC07_11110, partial [Chitinophagaceae bacterium]|nr:hypothetical protein [Chitinophagaceae bacterium]
DDMSYKKRIGDLYEKYYNEYKKTIDTNYRNIIANMYKHEYALRRLAEGPTRSEPLIRKWLAVEDSNMYELVPMIKSKGFPGEKRIGLSHILPEQVDDSRTGDRRNTYDFRMVSVNLNCHAATLFFHHRCGYMLLKEELMQAVLEGELHPREYALIYEWSHNYFAVKHWDDDYHDFRCEGNRQDEWYNIFIEPFLYSKDIAAVNKARAEIGMCSLDHDEKKKKFAIDNELYLYFGTFRKI